MYLLFYLKVFLKVYFSIIFLILLYYQFSVSASENFASPLPPLPIFWTLASPIFKTFCRSVVCRSPVGILLRHSSITIRFRAEARVDTFGTPIGQSRWFTELAERCSEGASSVPQGRLCYYHGYKYVGNGMVYPWVSDDESGDSHHEIPQKIHGNEIIMCISWDLVKVIFLKRGVLFILDKYMYYIGLSF